MVKLCWSQRARARHGCVKFNFPFLFCVRQCAVREPCILRFFFERALKQARLPVNMGGMGLTGAEDIRNAAWVGTWALVTRPIRELHRPFADLDVSTAPGECFDELRDCVCGEIYLTLP